MLKKMLVKFILSLIFIFCFSVNCFSEKLEISDNYVSYVTNRDVWDKMKDIYSSVIRANLLGDDYRVHDCFGKNYLNPNCLGIFKYRYTIEIDKSDNMVISKRGRGYQYVSRGNAVESLYNLICLFEPEEAYVVIDAPQISDKKNIVGREKAIKYMVYKGYAKLNEKNEFRPFDNIVSEDFLDMCQKVEGYLCKVDKN